MPPAIQVIRLAGLMSRWISPAACASARAPQAWSRRKTTRPAGSGPSIETRCCRLTPSQELHRVVEDALLGAAVVVDRDRARMREGGGQLHLPLEAGEGSLAGNSGRQQLDRRRPAQQRVARFVHDTHGSAPEPPDERVRADALDPAAQLHDGAQGRHGDESQSREDGSDEKDNQAEEARRQDTGPRRHAQPVPEVDGLVECNRLEVVRRR